MSEGKIVKYCLMDIKDLSKTIADFENFQCDKKIFFKVEDMEITATQFLDWIKLLRGES